MSDDNNEIEKEVGNAAAKNTEDDVARLKKEAVSLKVALFILSIGIVGNTFVGYKCVNSVCDVTNAYNNLSQVVGVLMDERALTSKMEAEFTEWSETDDGKKWIEEFEKVQSGEESDVMEKEEQAEEKVDEQVEQQSEEQVE